MTAMLMAECAAEPLLGLFFSRVAVGMLFGFVATPAAIWWGCR
jgi:hypothetical protein